MLANSLTINGAGRVFEWLAEASLRSTPLKELISGFCDSLNSHGFDIERVTLATAALHPSIRAQSLIWNRGGDVQEATYAHGVTTQAWQQSPLAMMMRTHTGMMRQRLTEPAERFEYALFGELKEQGETDWVAFAHMFHWHVDHMEGGEMGVLSSWTTRHPEGFSDPQIEALRPLVRALAAAVKSLMVIRSACNVLSAYIGDDAGMRVLRGAITRGSVSEVRAVLMFADLRGFTRYSAEQPIDRTLATLNSAFDCVGDAIAARGGEILKFIGDGVLAVFMLGADTPDGVVADRAIEAAIDAQKRLADSQAPLALDIALHVGTVNYGNIGAAQRLDFTVIGQAVNEVARLESLCGSLGEKILLSADLAALLPANAKRLRPLGSQALRGLDPMDVFGL